MTSASGPPPRSEGAVGWGILATGGIARLFTRDLLAHGHRVHAVGSRSAASASSFADACGIPRAHGSYEELVADPGVDVVYIATPHNFHAANAVLALQAGKHVLVEKAFTLNVAQAREVVDLAAAQGLLVMEAMWTRFLPHMREIRSWIRAGRIGEVRSLHADHTQSLPLDDTHRLNDPALAGGTLLDLGVYPISFAHDLLGPVHEVHAVATFKPTGVDGSVATVLRHASGAVSTSFSSSETRGPNRATILGTEGRIEIDATWYAPAPVTLYDSGNQPTDHFEEAVTGRGMQFQAAEVERLLGLGATVSALMSPADSVAVMATMDVVRRRIGLRYPEE
ncbi:MAG: oxidoreductase domain protein [Nocardioides sp.]|nr:oxidoreductase domain protein [Nocardioides sp.]